jgi:hypothetical protein
MKQEFTQESPGLVRKEKSLDDPITRKEIVDFGKFLKSLESAMCPRSMDYYGYPLDQEKFPGYVLNELLNGVHWSVVDYAEKEKAIRNTKGRWAIVSQEIGWSEKCHAILREWPKFSDLEINLKLLKQLNSQIEYGKSLGVQQAMGEDGSVKRGGGFTQMKNDWIKKHRPATENTIRR